MRLRPLYLAALLAVGLFSISTRADAQVGDDQMERPEVRDLRLTGVRSVEQDELREALATQESRCRSVIVAFLCAIRKWNAVYQREYLDRQEFRRDVLRIKVFYFQRGFRDAEVDTAVTPLEGDRVRVTFSVTEGPPTLVERVEVMRPPALIGDRTLARFVQLRAGQPFNTLRLDTTLVRLRRAMWDQGYADAQIVQRAVVDTTTRRARVFIGIEPGVRSTVGEIRVQGNERVETETIRNSLLFEKGDVFRIDDLLRSQRALYEAALFRRAAIYVAQPGESTPCAAFDAGLADDDDDPAAAARPDSVKRIEVCVEEADLREARASTGFNSIDFIQVDGRFTHHNFLGGARRLDLQATVGNLLAEQLNDRLLFRNVYKDVADRARYYAPTYQTSANVRQRWFGGPRNTLSAGVFANRRSAPGIFVDRGYGATSTLTREIAARATTSLGYRFEITTVDAGDVYFCVNYGVCDRPTISALRARQALSPAVFTSSIDRSNDPFAPTTGYRARVDLDHASALTLSDFRYNRGYAEASLYRRVGGAGGTVATRLRGGLVRALSSTAGATGIFTPGDGEILHPRRRFYAGGSQSVRGYGENQLGPRVLTIPAATLRGPEGTRCNAPDIRDCNPNAYVLPSGEVASYDNSSFEPRPLGGNAYVEGSVELRLPVLPNLLGGNLVGALFVDAGWLRGRSLGGETRADGAITPGFGVRYRSPVGPIRVDIGVNPFLQETLPVITEEVTDGERRLVRLRTPRVYEPGRGAGGLTRTLQRLTLPLSIGEAF